MKKPKSKGVERVKTDKSIKADHKGQNIIQTVKVTVQAPKQEAKKVKRKRKTSAGSSVTGSKKEAIAELQSNMERFKSLKEQAQKMGIKLPASIGESKYSIDNVKSIADIKGLTQEIMLKNSQIEALIKGSSGAVASSAQLPQQPSSFAPQIVERSQAPPPQPSGRVPSPPQAPQAQSDKDIEAALKAQEAENAKKATAPGELNVEIDALKKNATVPGELNVEIDALDKNAGKTTIGAEGREETLAKMAADKEAEDVREQEERLKMNQEDNIKFQLTRDKADETMTDQELTTELTGDVNVAIADVGLQTGPRVVKDAVDKLESIEIDTQIDNQNILELLRVISVEANDAQKATPIQPEIVEKIKKAYKSETMKEYTGHLDMYGDVSNVLTELEDSLAKKNQDQAALEKAKKEQTLKEQDEALTEAQAEQDEIKKEITESVQRMIDGFNTKVRVQPGFSAPPVELVGTGDDKKADFRSLQTFLGNPSIHDNAFEYLQMIGSLKDEDIAFAETSDNKSLSLRNVTKNVVGNTNKFLTELTTNVRKAKGDSDGSLIDLDLQPKWNKKSPVKYSDFIASVRSKVEHFDNILSEIAQNTSTGEETVKTLSGAAAAASPPPSDSAYTDSSQMEAANATDAAVLANLKAANAITSSLFSGGSGSG